MKMIVIGLGGAISEVLFKDERLTNVRRLMEFGCYGQMENVIPATPVPTWMCMTTSQDPGSLGVYGSINRADFSYDNFRIATSESIEGIAIWDHMARAGKKSIIIDVPPSYPPLKVDGIFVGYDIHSNANNTIFTYPQFLREEITKVLGEPLPEAKDSLTDGEDRFKVDVYTVSRKQFRMIRHLMRNYEWDYFHFVNMGLVSLQRTFRKPDDLSNAIYEPRNLYENVIGDYYLYLDDELGRIFDLLDDDTAILIVSCHGAQPVDGGISINEWLAKEGLLVLNDYSKEVTPFNKQNINWEKTKAWSEGGQDAYVFLNVKGREPKGTINKLDYEKFRNDIMTRLEESLLDESPSLGTFAFKPEEIYKSVHNIPPDLIVHVGRSPWHLIGSAENRTAHTQEKQTRQDERNPTQSGSFILASTNNSLHGEVKGAHLLDMVPTLLKLGGYDIPALMQGRSLIAGKIPNAASNMNSSANEEEAVRQRLKGLGYI